MLRLPDNSREITDEDERQALRTKVEKSIVQHVYIQETVEKDPVLPQIWTAGQSQTIGHLMRYSTNSWYTGLSPFRQCLIRLWKNWDQIAPGQQCPIHFTEAELQQKLEDGETFNMKEDFWDDLDGVVLREGWDTHENYEDAFEFFRVIREEGLRDLEGEEKEAFDESTKWVLRSEEKHT